MAVAHDLHDARPDRHADAQRQLLHHRGETHRAAEPVLVDVGVGDGVDGGEFERAEIAADEQNAEDQRDRRRRREQPVHSDEGGADDGVDHENPAKAHEADDRLCRGLHRHRAGRRDEGGEARAQGAHTEAELQHQGQQQRHRADPDAKQRAAGDADPERRDFQQRQVDDRRRDAPGMPDVEAQHRRAERHQHRRLPGRQEPAPHDRQAEDEAEQAARG